MSEPRRLRMWSFYSLADGTFTGRRFTTSSPELLAANTPEGCAAIAGRHDRQTARVDLETGEVVAYEPPPDARRERDRAEARIARLESRQARPIRELFLNPNNAEAKRRLQEIEDEIAALRPRLQSS